MVSVDYTYNGDYGTDQIFMVAYALLDDGNEVPGTVYTPASVVIGDGHAKVDISMKAGSGGKFTSNTILVCMVINGGNQFYCEKFPYTKLWSS